MSEPSLLLPQAITAIPAFLLWLSMALSIGISLAYACAHTITFLTQDIKWQTITAWTRSLLKWLLMGALGNLCLLAIPLAVNWLPFWKITPILSSLSILIPEIILVLTTILLAIRVWKGEKRMTPRAHLTTVWLLSLFVGLSLWIPVAVMAWMEYPQESWISFQDLSIVASHPWYLVFSALGILKFCLLITSSWVIGGGFLLIACLRNPCEKELAKRSAIIAISMVLIGGVLTLCIGDSTGYSIAGNQPMKMAAIQQLEKGQRKAPLVIAGPIQIPELLSRLATHSNNGFVPGMSDIINGEYTTANDTPAHSFYQKRTKASQAFYARRKDSTNISATWDMGKRYWGYLYLSCPEESIPNTLPLFVAFRLMVGGGFLLLLFATIQIAGWIRTEIQERIWFKYAGTAIMPLALFCSLCGWYISLYGMHPWAITELLAVSSAISSLPLWVLGVEFLLVVGGCILWTIFIGKQLKSIIVPS